MLFTDVTPPPKDIALELSEVTVNMQTILTKGTIPRPLVKKKKRPGMLKASFDGQFSKNHLGEYLSLSLLATYLDNEVLHFFAKKDATAASSGQFSLVRGWPAEVRVAMMLATTYHGDMKRNIAYFPFDVSRLALSVDGQEQALVVADSVDNLEVVYENLLNTGFADKKGQMRIV